jgi:hypothetical protein
MKRHDMKQIIAVFITMLFLVTIFPFATVVAPAPALTFIDSDYQSGTYTQGYHDASYYYIIAGNYLYIYTFASDVWSLQTYDYDDTVSFVDITGYDGGGGTTYLFVTMGTDGVRCYSWDGYSLTNENTFDDGDDFQQIWMDDTSQHMMHLTAGNDGIRNLYYSGGTIQDNYRDIDDGGYYDAIWGYYDSESADYYIFASHYGSTEGITAYAFDMYGAGYASVYSTYTYPEHDIARLWGEEISGTIYVYSCDKSDGLFAYSWTPSYMSGDLSLEDSVVSGDDSRDISGDGTYVYTAWDTSLWTYTFDGVDFTDVYLNTDSTPYDGVLAIIPQDDLGVVGLCDTNGIYMYMVPTGESNYPPTFGTPSPTNSSTGQSLSFSWQIPINDPEGDTFNWTIQCNNTQHNEANGASNGTKSLSLSGLSYSHSYKIWVNATDLGSKQYTRAWYTFQTKTNSSPTFGTPSPTNGSTGNSRAFTWQIPINDPNGDTFNWTIQCNNTQHNEANGASNGTKSLVLSGLSYSHSYKIWVNATDYLGSKQYTRRWYTFQTGANQAPAFGTPSPTNGSTGQATSLTWSIPITDGNGDTFNWTLQCSNGQHNETNGASNGTKSLSLSGLSYSTTYKVWVNATDGLTTTRRWYTFETLVNSPPSFGTPSPTNGSTGNSRALTWQISITDVNGGTFNWSIQCSNTQHNEANGATNGTKTLSLSGLSYLTTYTIWVNATDGIEWTRHWYTLQTADNIAPSFGTPSPTNGSNGPSRAFSWQIYISDYDAFNWSIQCSNGQHNEANGATNGTKTLSLSGLSYATTYTIWVNATGSPWRRAWYTFTTAGGEINFTATPGANADITVTPNVWDVEGASLGMHGVSNTSDFTIENTGLVQVDVTINATDSSAWSLGSSPSHNQFRLQYGLGGDVNYVFAAGTTTQKVYQYWESNMTKRAETGDYGGIIYAFTDENETYVYYGGATTRQVIQCWKVNLTQKANSSTLGGNIHSLAEDDDYIYAATSDDKKVYILWKSNLTTKAVSDDFGISIYTMVKDGDYIYIGGGTNQRVFQLWASNLTKKANSTLYNAASIDAIVCDDDYVYAGGYGGEIWQFWKTNMTKKTASTNYGGPVKALVQDDDYIYAGGTSINKISQFWKSNMTKTSLEVNYGGGIYSLYLKNGYIYAGGATIQKVHVYWTSNLTKKAETESYGGIIYSIGVFPTEIVWTDMTLTRASFLDDFAWDQSQHFGLSMWMPTSSSTNAVQTIIVTFIATAD